MKGKPNMQTKSLPNHHMLLMAIVVFGTVLVSWPASAAIRPHFTFQGRFADGDIPGPQNYDMRFTLFDAPFGGTPIGSPITNGAVVANNGLFTVGLDFGAEAF